MLRFIVFFVILIMGYSAADDSLALSLKQTIPPTIYYADGTTYTLAPNEVIHIAKKGDTVYTKEEGDDSITFIVNYPSKKRDYDFVPVESDPCAFSLCTPLGE